MFDLGMQELIVIFVVALLVFGPKRLPELGRTIGKWVVEIRRGINVARAQMENEISEANYKLPADIVASLPKELREEGKQQPSGQAAQSSDQPGSDSEAGKGDQS
ncbi:MAG: hypothetical protein OHK006_00610 [Thermodesulfovibrionales bacterium]